jgi:hypothetical protein
MISSFTTTQGRDLSTPTRRIANTFIREHVHLSMSDATNSNQTHRHTDTHRHTHTHTHTHTHGQRVDTLRSMSGSACSVVRRRDVASTDDDDDDRCAILLFLSAPNCPADASASDVISSTTARCRSRSNFYRRRRIVVGDGTNQTNLSCFTSTSRIGLMSQFLNSLDKRQQQVNNNELLTERFEIRDTAARSRSRNDRQTKTACRLGGQARCRSHQTRTIGYLKTRRRRQTTRTTASSVTIDGDRR